MAATDRATRIDDGRKADSDGERGVDSTADCARELDKD
jgi:hypothetical protein